MSCALGISTPQFFGSYDRFEESGCHFYERHLAGSGLARCISAVGFLKNPKIEILKMTVWFVLKLVFGANHVPRAGSSPFELPSMAQTVWKWSGN